MEIERVRIAAVVGIIGLVCLVFLNIFWCNTAAKRNVEVRKSIESCQTDADCVREATVLWKGK